MEPIKQISESNTFDQLVYVRPTEACNMNCDHCFIPANPKKMDLKDCYLIPKHLEKIAKAGDRVILQWHGGEPTLFGKSNFKKVLKHISLEVKDKTIIHGIQTNLMNYDSEWGEIYKSWFGGRIGVSWDKDIRQARHGDFDTLFMSSVEKLRLDGIEYDLTITASKPFFDWVMSKPWEFFEFIEVSKPSSLHIEKITKTGNARLNWDKVGVSNLEYSQLLTLIYVYSKTWMSNVKDWFDGISPLSDYEADIFALSNDLPLQLRGCTSGACDTRFHTIDANGYKFGCTALNSEADNKSSAVAVSLISPKELVAIRESRVRTCVGCDFASICNTGCITSTKVDESGECNGGFTLRNNILHSLQQMKKDQ
ncbi:hypothetical protein OTK49_26645 [Vibrio coralliirubri]|uniref:radical SAM protein n=1 Tax=Vibrio coralliirubri TaxID=1516159 RepID=UPI002283BE78|nr:radical SAM protein [Vibrio coralliirubri]MCY9866120.1 hypothetical protein [Vibrio coralliirubri]